MCASRVALAAGPGTTVLDLLCRRLPRVEGRAERAVHSKVLGAR